MSNHVVCTECLISQSKDENFKKQLGGKYVFNKIHGSLRSSHLVHRIDKNIDIKTLRNMIDNIYANKKTNETVHISIPTTSYELRDTLIKTVEAAKDKIYMIDEDVTISTFNSVRE